MSIETLIIISKPSDFFCHSCVMSPGWKHPIVAALPSATAPDREKTLEDSNSEHLEMTWENQGNYWILQRKDIETIKSKFK